MIRYLRRFVVACVAISPAMADATMNITSFTAAMARQSRLQRTGSPLADTIQTASDDVDDYTCTKTKHCNLGCCGPLYVFPCLRFCNNDLDVSRGLPRLTIVTSVGTPKEMEYAALGQTSAATVAPRRVTTSRSAIRAGASSGPTPPTARSTCAAAPLASAAPPPSSAAAP